jgi:hypothetical protein
MTGTTGQSRTPSASLASLTSGLVDDTLGKLAAKGGVDIAIPGA